MRKRETKASRQESLEKAFDYFYREYFPAIYRYAFRLVGDFEESGQLAQQTFTKLLGVYTSNSTIENPKALVYRIATNLCFDYLRKKRVVNEAMNNGVLYHNRQNNLDEEFIKKQRSETVRKALLNLSKRDQECLLLYQEGFSYAEIAETMKIKKTSVGKLLSRATEKLARIIKTGERQ